jgi:hypothetical protein|tara:strand:+ start:257 stop:529 length:273 start_codon:yes stop_codon:yes gene_type:complete
MKDQEQIVTLQKDSGEKIEYRKADMSEEQQALMEEIVSYQQRLLILEPLAREFTDKKELVNLKTEALKTMLETKSATNADSEEKNIEDND